MLVIALVAVALGQSVKALRVINDPNERWLVHLWRRSDGHHERSVCLTPTWPRLWRRMACRPWPGSYDCDGEGLPGNHPAGATLVETHAASPGEAAGIRASLRSLKTIGSGEGQGAGRGSDGRLVSTPSLTSSRTE
jgi:hypothetical protein